jgi:hypothetical protein
MKKKAALKRMFNYSKRVIHAEAEKRRIDKI